MITKHYVVRWPSDKKNDGIILTVCGKNRWLNKGLIALNPRAQDVAYIFTQKFRYCLRTIDRLTTDECYDLLVKGGEI